MDGDVAAPRRPRAWARKFPRNVIVVLARRKRDDVSPALMYNAGPAVTLFVHILDGRFREVFQI